VGIIPAAAEKGTPVASKGQMIFRMGKSRIHALVAASVIGFGGYLSLFPMEYQVVDLPEMAASGDNLIPALQFHKYIEEYLRTAKAIIADESGMLHVETEPESDAHHTLA